MAPRGSLVVLSTIGVMALAAGSIALLRWREPADSDATFVGSDRCAQCHSAEAAAWKSSQHAVAMQAATLATVLGRFDGTRYTNGQVTSTFFRRGDALVVNTEGADGANHDFELRYTFGVWPLQQYLIEQAGGRLQALTIAWDARPASEGGQRWFTLYPETVIAHTDAFHWTGRENNWNFMCADCHSTDVRKGYDASTDTFHTTRSEISVGCEACHGPGSRHVRWGGTPTLVRRVIWPNDELPAQLTERRGIRWVTDSGARIAHRSAARRSDREIDVCAQCHASRAHIAEGYVAGAALMDHYIPSLILPDLYFADGQQRDEVYDYGSFLQSRMYRAGVTCADCHDPHTQRLRAPGNEVCTQCHWPAAYDTPAHHFHAAGSESARCVSCHMSDTTYMQVDPRHDHSMRVPRPDLSVRFGVPNACTRCHRQRDARWAAQAVIDRYGAVRRTGIERFTAAFVADEQRSPSASDSLAGVFGDSAQPAIVRASALARLARYPNRAAFDAARRGADDRNALVRLAALQVLEAFPPRERVMVAVPLLGDTTRAVRQGAAWLLAPIGDSLRTPLQRSAFASAAAEFVASQRYNADRAGNRLALAAFYTQASKLDSATTEYQAALHLSPQLREARLGLAAVLSARGRIPDAILVLESARTSYPRDRDVLLALAILSRNSGDSAAAVGYAREVLAAHPEDAQAKQLLRSVVQP